MKLRQTIGNGNPLLREIISVVNINYTLSADTLVDLSKSAYKSIFEVETDEEALAYALICLSILNADTIDTIYTRHKGAVQCLADGLETELTTLSIIFNLDNSTIIKLLESLVEFFPNHLEVLSEDSIKDISKFISDTF